MQGLGISYFRGGAKYTDAMRYNIKGKKSMPICLSGFSNKNLFMTFLLRLYSQRKVGSLCIYL